MESLLLPDERWKIFYGITSYQEFIDKFKLNLYLTPKASEEIKGIFRVIQKILLFSYFDYEFVDVAAERAKLKLETVLKIRYKEINGKVWSKNKNYKKLLSWFDEGGYFEWSSKEILDHVRQLRNITAHAEMHSYAGMMSLHHIQTFVSLINDTYESQSLRKDRKSRTDQLNCSINKLLDRGCTLQVEDSAEILIHSMSLEFINNKNNPPIFHFYYRATFSVPIEFKASDPIPIVEWQPLECNFIEETGDQMVGINADGKNIFTLKLIQNPEIMVDWSSWKKHFDSYKSTMILFDHANSFDINEYCLSIREKFHKG